MKKCKFCKESFIPKRLSQLFCSNACRIKYFCHKYYYDNHEKQKKRVLSNYYKYKKTRYLDIRNINIKAKEKQRFGESSSEIKKRFGNKCVFCGATGKLYIHHLDKNGRNVKNPNNKIYNKVPCCPHCHTMIHLHNVKLKMKI
jgi:hypothetical protein